VLGGLVTLNGKEAVRLNIVSVTVVDATTDEHAASVQTCTSTFTVLKGTRKRLTLICALPGGVTVNE
jgi:hypothetical protein